MHKWHGGVETELTFSSVCLSSGGKSADRNDGERVKTKLCLSLSCRERAARIAEKRSLAQPRSNNEMLQNFRIRDVPIWAAQCPRFQNEQTHGTCTSPGRMLANCAKFNHSVAGHVADIVARVILGIQRGIRRVGKFLTRQEQRFAPIVPSGINSSFALCAVKLQQWDLRLRTGRYSDAFVCELREIARRFGRISVKINWNSSDPSRSFPWRRNIMHSSLIKKQRPVRKEETQFLYGRAN